MKTIYPEKTLAMLAEWDKLIEEVMDMYKRHYPEDWFHRFQFDPIYQACIRGKTDIIMTSTYTIQLDANETMKLNEQFKRAGEG